MSTSTTNRDTATVTPLHPELLAAFDEAQAALAATPTKDLLQLAYRLTHQIDSYHRQAERVAGPDRRCCGTRISDLRQQRNMIDAELIRRAGA